MTTEFTNKLADASTSRLAFRTEEVWGEIDSATVSDDRPAARVLRFTSESLSTTPTTITSDEITSRRTVSDLSLTHYETGGDISGEFSPTNWDEFLAASLLHEGFGEDGTGTISDATEITDRKTSFSFEKYFPLGGTMNQNDKYTIFRGMLVNTMNLSVATRELATLSFGFLGKDVVALEHGAMVKEGNPAFPANMHERTVFGAEEGALIPASATSIINASSNVGNIHYGGSMTDRALVRSITLDVNNNLRGQSAIGDIGNVGVGVGRSEITGTIEVYFKDFELYKKFLDNKASELSFTLTGKGIDGTTSVSYTFRIPRLKFTESGQPITGNNSDVITTASFQAIASTTESEHGASLLITKA